ncbi:HAD family hydrolase [Thiorhodospira sibirica]|uniref:histidinol-phosphatase n=1 Tax=Thiorhodospira sibirica TaxID=154347 RepID=UPI00022C1138|nr:HAD family hydrolase [Thiorhodospira sibirica]
MALAIFDLDNTLIGGDSDHEWGRFLIQQGIVDASVYEAANERFYQQYREGTLDIAEFCRFSFAVLAAHELPTLLAWRARFVQKHIEPLLLPAADDLLAQHRARGDTLLIITATNRFVTEPIAAKLGVDHLLATEPEIKDGRYTGELDGIPCFQHGKVQRLQQWLAQHPAHDLRGSWFYSDSHNDLPLLSEVAHPVVVDADPTLLAHAQHMGWRTLSLR